MVEAHFSLVVKNMTSFMRNMMSLDVDTLRMGGKGFCSGAIAWDRIGSQAGSTTASSPKNH